MATHKQLKYEDICLIPNYSECKSRSECSTFTYLGGQQFKLPVIPANMKSVISPKLAKWMSENRYFYIMHRFDIDMTAFLTQSNEEDWQTISISVGVNEKDKDLLVKAAALKLRIDYITIDIAHGHSLNMKRMIKHTKRCFPNTYLIAGNVATPQAVKDLANWGADAVKVGIGQGSPCTTKDKTGFTMPMFSCVQNCSNLYSGEFGSEGEEIQIIADGGIKCNGDISKALSAGASMAMAGGMFAACTDSPAATTTINNIPHKAYFGSASAENKGHSNHIEGKLTNICTNNVSYKEKLKEIKQDLQSAISYAGGNNLDSLRGVNYEVVN